MRPLLAAAVLILASGAAAPGASAQTDARLYGAWRAQTDSLSGVAELVSMWMEFDASGRMFARMHLREELPFDEGVREEQMAALFAYTAVDGVVTANGSPGRVVFHEGGGMRVSGMDGSQAIEFARARATVTALDVLGSWEITKGPAETVTFDVEGESMPVRFYVQDRLLASGEWSVGEEGVRVDAPGFGSTLYTGIMRDGDRITLTGLTGERLVLSLIEAAVPRQRPDLGSETLQDIEVIDDLDELTPLPAPPPPPEEDGEPLKDGEGIGERADD